MRELKISRGKDRGDLDDSRLVALPNGFSAESGGISITWTSTDALNNRLQQPIYNVARKLDSNRSLRRKHLALFLCVSQGGFVQPESCG